MLKISVGKGFAAAALLGAVAFTGRAIEIKFDVYGMARDCFKLVKGRVQAHLYIHQVISHICCLPALEI